MMWLTSFKAKATVETKQDIESDLTSGQEKNYQITAFFINRFGLEALKKINNLIAPEAIEEMTFTENIAKLVAYFKKA